MVHSVTRSDVTIFLMQNWDVKHYSAHNSCIKLPVILPVTLRFGQQSHCEQEKNYPRHAAVLRIQLDSYWQLQPYNVVLCVSMFQVTFTMYSSSMLRCSWLMPRPLHHRHHHSLTCNPSMQPEWRLEPALPSTQSSHLYILGIERVHASTSMYSLTFRVTTPRSMDEMERRTQQARRFYRRWGESLPACVVRAVGLADYGWALPRISIVLP